MSISGTQIPSCQSLIDEICAFDWRSLTRQELIDIAWIYYFFSVQFRESLEIARRMFPDDNKLLELDRGERNTDNLSPWPGVATVGERINHDEFMRRTLQLTAVDADRRAGLETIGARYLAKVRATDDTTRILSLASYEDGGLEVIFKSILDAPDWRDPLLQAFRHFLIQHIKFDGDPEHGHGGLCRHLAPSDTVASLWMVFRESLVAAVPRFARQRQTQLISS